MSCRPSSNGFPTPMHHDPTDPIDDEHQDDEHHQEHDEHQDVDHDDECQDTSCTPARSQN